MSPLPTKWMRLALLLLERYDKEKRKKDLDESIESMEKGIELAIVDHNARLSEAVSNWALRRILDLWKKRKTSKEQVESPEEMEKRVYKAVKWADSLPNADIDSRTGWRKLLANELAELKHLRNAVAVAGFGYVTPLARKFVPDLYEKLGDELMKRYDLTKDASDLDEAIKWMREAFEAHSHDPDPSLVVGEQQTAIYEKLSSYFMLRYDLKKDPNDMDEAIKWTREAFKAPGGQKIDMLVLFSGRFWLQYLRDKRLEILNEAIDLASRIVATTDLSAKIGQLKTYSQFLAISIRLGERFRKQR
ncbi:uncharacterized protein FFNC_15403 [Fusarium fujikuroi]|nr:uncharacterized protein FFNC_15403 [Fusarium fujikuroi]